MAHSEQTHPSVPLNRYDIGIVEQATPGGGTAGRTWRVVASSGAYLLRMRGTRTSTLAHLEFDHGLRAHLAAQGFPTVKAVSTRHGERWVSCAGRVYELYPFVTGRSYDPGCREELVCAAQTLAAFHRAALDYRPPKSWAQQVAQYTSLGFSDRKSRRMDDPDLQLVNLCGVRELATTPEGTRLVDRCIARVQRLRYTYGRAAYERITGYVIHGDYTPANLLYSPDGQVVGVFDFDWSMDGPRCLDVAYGLCFFASEPRELDGASIWSLTEAPSLSFDRCTAFLGAYNEIASLTADEIDTLPRAFCSLWLSKRLEGMAKVGHTERFRFFSRNVEQPLTWMDSNWARLRAAFLGEQT